MNPNRRLTPLFLAAAFLSAWSQSSACGATLSLSPASGDVSRIVAGEPPGTTFLFSCGTYRLKTPIRPLPGDTFIGAGAINGLPSSPPCATISGAVVIHDWTHTNVGSHHLWYSRVGRSRILNIRTGLQVNCMLQGGGVSGNAYLMWTPATPISAGDSVIDANGNTETAENAGITASGSGPLWTRQLGGLTTDNGITWKLTALNSAAGCSYPQDLFFTPANDNDVRHSVVKNHVLAWNGGNLGPRDWYIDFENVGGHGNFVIYVAENPAHYRVELTLVPQAFVVRGPNVRILNLTIEKFATPNLHGSVEPEGMNDIVANNWITHSHGEGIELHLPSAVDVTIDSNEVVEMGESGINTGDGRATRVINNRIERNNEDGTAYGYEAGGTKFANDSNTLVRGNIVSCNNGNGLWGDAGEEGAIYADNRVAHNLYNGITYEISHHGAIVRNILTDNAQSNACQCIAAHLPVLNGHDVCTGFQTCSGSDCSLCTDGKNEIYIHTSDTTTVGGSARNGNVITSNCAGIQINQDGRLRVHGNTVSYNTLILHTGSGVINTPLGGYDQTFGFGFDMYAPSSANSFEHNSYRFDTRVASRVNKQWQWKGSDGSTNQACNWSAWQEHGQDLHGSVIP